MAEISVPAWPIPIHHTKFTMANPHATGMVMAQMPTPFRNSQVTATSSMTVTPPASAKPKNQPSGVCGVSTIRDSLSVTERNVCPGAMTRCSPVSGSIIGS